MTAPATSSRVRDALAVVVRRVDEGPGDGGLDRLLAGALADGVDALRRPGGSIDPRELTELFTAATGDELTSLDWSLFGPDEPDELREFLCARLADRALLERVAAHLVTGDDAP